MPPRPDVRLPSVGEEEFLLPATEAILAGTLALMTGFAQSEPQAGVRQRMALKLVHNLQLLTERSDLSASMRTVLNRLEQQWRRTACADLAIDFDGLSLQAMPGCLQ